MTTAARRSPFYVTSKPQHPACDGILSRALARAGEQEFEVTMEMLRGELPPVEIKNEVRRRQDRIMHAARQYVEALNNPGAIDVTASPDIA